MLGIQPQVTLSIGPCGQLITLGWHVSAFGSTDATLSREVEDLFVAESIDILSCDVEDSFVAGDIITVFVGTRILIAEAVDIQPVNSLLSGNKTSKAALPLIYLKFFGEATAIMF